MDLLRTEELLLIALDDRAGSWWHSNLKVGLAGGLLTDLAGADLLRLDGKVLRAAPAVRAAHPLLLRAYEVIAGSPTPRSPKSWVQRLHRDLRPFIPTIADTLVEQGVLARDRRKILGLFPVTRFPLRDPVPKRELRERLGQVLTGQYLPTDPDALLLGLLVPLQLVDRLVDKPDRRAARRRAKAIAEAGIAGDAVSQVVREVQSAAVAAAAAAAAGGAAGGAGG